jgi:hypothetical protein
MDLCFKPNSDLGGPRAIIDTSWHLDAVSESRPPHLLGRRGILNGPFQMDARSNAAFNASVSNKHFFDLASREQE